MRLSDAMKPAMEWSEAAMLPARARTISQGAALRQLRQLEGLDTAGIYEELPAPKKNMLETRFSSLGRAAYRQVRRLF
ncbi:MAG: hypothetical protein IJ157_07500 [Clostridia bacterium]|nr:hypothetical protein [Clostridia bacterium]